MVVILFLENVNTKTKIVMMEITVLMIVVILILVIVKTLKSPVKIKSFVQKMHVIPILAAYTHPGMNTVILMIFVKFPDVISMKVVF
jgi:hypothetical protein